MISSHYGVSATGEGTFEDAVVWLVLYDLQSPPRLYVMRQVREQHCDVRELFAPTPAPVRSAPHITPVHVAYESLDGRAVWLRSVELFINRPEVKQCLVVVAPATADLMAKMAHGHADDLASAILLAADKPILLAPAMNPLMWSNRATQRNLAQLIDDPDLAARLAAARAQRPRRRSHDLPEPRSQPRSRARPRT